MITDNFFSTEVQQALYDYVSRPGWTVGWKSNTDTDKYGFLHKTYAGTNSHAFTDFYDCADELAKRHPILHGGWEAVKATLHPRHTLVRCYANGMPFGTFGNVHRDCESGRSWTTIYYPHPKWHADWGGETCFFNHDWSDLLGAVFPKPNRCLSFAGNAYHCARPVTRECPHVRITLMYKTIEPKYERLVVLSKGGLPTNALAFLQLHTTRIPHSGASLFAHLLGTYDILVGWNVPVEVCLAGAFHSIYGTEIFKTATTNNRVEVVGLIGGPAERIAHRFCTEKRVDFLKENSLDGTHLRTIQAANLLEQGGYIDQQLVALLNSDICEAAKATIRHVMTLGK